MSYIEREAFLAKQRHLYCDNCARRKNSKGKFVYDIGDAPCRACSICDVLDAVEDAPAADVRPVVLCRDCQYAYDSVGGWCCSHGICVDCIVREDFFCADGEKREES